MSTLLFTLRSSFPPGSHGGAGEEFSVFSWQCCLWAVCLRAIFGFAFGSPSVGSVRPASGFNLSAPNPTPQAPRLLPRCFFPPCPTLLAACLLPPCSSARGRRSLFHRAKLHAPHLRYLLLSTFLPATARAKPAPAVRLTGRFCGRPLSLEKSVARCD
jgi:hypothetical protein